MYPALFSHSSPKIAAHTSDGPMPDPTQWHGRQFRSDRGHGTGFFVSDTKWGFRISQTGELVEGFNPAATMDRMVQYGGKARANVSAQHITIFPNFSVFA